jgi:hypothetical protein
MRGASGMIWYFWPISVSNTVLACKAMGNHG